MILILDDHPLVRQGLETIIKMHDKNIRIVHAGNIEEAKAFMEYEDISIAFIDLNLGDESGFDFVRWLKISQKEVKIFIITSSSKGADFSMAKELGVDAYILKDAFVDEIMFGLKLVERGGKFYSAGLMEQENKLPKEKKLIDRLTDRELEVLCELSKGISNSTIGESLCISEGTVKKHISSILSKLELKNRMEAIVFANKNDSILGLVSARADNIHNVERV